MKIRTQTRKKPTNEAKDENTRLLTRRYIHPKAYWTKDNSKMSKVA